MRNFPNSDSSIRREEGRPSLQNISRLPAKFSPQRSEPKIDYENLETIQNFPEGFPFGGSSITWDGEIESSESGDYEFKLYYAGYTRVYMDGVEVVPERWRTAWNPNTYKFRVKLEAGKRIPVSRAVET